MFNLCEILNKGWMHDVGPRNLLALVSAWQLYSVVRGGVGVVVRGRDRDRDQIWPRDVG